MYVHTNVEIPKKLTAEQIELVQKLSESLGEGKPAHAEKRKIFKKR